MSFFTNKHVITAFIVAPVLAVAGYYAVDLLIKEKPQAAVAGLAYPLSARSNCRYTSGECDLVNGEFRSQLVVVQEEGYQMLSLNSSHALEDVKIGFLDTSQTADASTVQPTAMHSVTEDMRSWLIEMPMVATEEIQLMIAMRSNGSHYFAETRMGFSEYQTTFNKDFKND